MEFNLKNWKKYMCWVSTAHVEKHKRRTERKKNERNWNVCGDCEMWASPNSLTIITIICENGKENWIRLSSCVPSNWTKYAMNIIIRTWMHDSAKYVWTYNSTVYPRIWEIPTKKSTYTYTTYMYYYYYYRPMYYSITVSDFRMCIVHGSFCVVLRIHQHNDRHHLLVPYKRWNDEDGQKKSSAAPAKLAAVA